MRGTNPKLWNNWKASLFAEFYERMNAGAAPRPREPDRPGRADRAKRKHARASCCTRDGIAEAAIADVWQRFTDTLFPAHTPDGDRLAHAAACASGTRRPIAARCRALQQPGRGGTGDLDVHAAPQHSFARTTALLDQLGLNIVDARITPTADGFSLDVYHVLEDTGARDRRSRLAFARSSSSSWRVLRAARTATRGR